MRSVQAAGGTAIATPNRRYAFWAVLLGALGFVADFLAKRWALANLDPASPVQVIPGQLYLHLIRNPGVIEAPYGLTLRQLMDHFGGGMKPGSRFHFALCGGAAGTIVPESLLDTPLDYKSMQKGLSLGAGAFLICDQTVSPVALLRELMWFFEQESCGKCTPCRIGTHQTRLLLDRILAGDRHPDDVERLTSLAELMGAASFCGLGQSTKLPILSALEHFKSDFR